MEQLRFLLYNVTAMKQEQQIHYTANEAAYQVVMPLGPCQDVLGDQTTERSAPKDLRMR